MNLETGKSSVFLERPGADLYLVSTGRPIAKKLCSSPNSYPARRCMLLPSPVTNARAKAPGSQSRTPRYGRTRSTGLLMATGSMLCRIGDGLCCMWAYPVEAATKRPVEKPMAVFHSHVCAAYLRAAVPESHSGSYLADGPDMSAIPLLQARLDALTCGYPRVSRNRGRNSSRRWACP